MQFRIAEKSDAQVIARIHATCWADVYGFMPREVLLSRSFEYRLGQWEGWFNSPDGVVFIIYNEECPVGFCHAGACSDPDLLVDGEMRAGYVLPKYRGGRVGIGIMQNLGKWMMSEGMSSAGIWAFSQNKYRHWYTHLGWKITVRRNRFINGYPIPEIGYRWDGIGELLKKMNKLENITSERSALE